MKKYIMMFLLFATPITYSMDYYNNLWQKYVEWRNPQLVQKIKEKHSIIEQKQHLPTIINEYYEKEKPFYIKMLAGFTPLESQEAVIKKAYNDLDRIFTDTFYPGEAQRTFLITQGQMSNELSQKLEEIKKEIEKGKTTKTEEKEFNDLKNKIKEFVEKVRLKIGIDVENRIGKRLDEFITLLDALTIEQPIPIVERWHRDRIADRMKKYIELK